MPLRHDVPIVSDLVFVSGHGDIAAADGVALADALLADHRLAPRFGVLVRLAEAQITLGPADLPEVGRVARRLVARGLRGTAIVAADDDGYDAGALVASQAGAVGTPVGVFRDDLEAVTWLLAHAD